jgi:2,3-bisphosphoglycerate-independent phosphoglycerate mutase
MSTAKITAQILQALPKYDFICANFACPDMIGHTGNLAAAIKSVKAVDGYVKQVVQAALKHNAAVIITADHGNVEYMLNLNTKEMITEHTTNPVPFIVVCREKLKLKKIKDPILANVAPTILKLFNLKKPSLMNKESLI